MEKSNVGVIGLGNMGGGIAANLGKPGRNVYVWDIADAARKRFEDKAGFISAQPGVMARECETILFVVPATPEIRFCLEGKDGIVANARGGLTLCDLTTSDPLKTRELSAELAPYGIHYVDAGTSGGRVRAESGELTLMVGGERQIFDRVKPLFDDIAKAIYYLGASGAGHTMKLLHNIVCHATFLATTEAFCLGESAGLKLKDMVDVLNHSNGRSYATESRFPNHILSGKWDGGSRIFNLYKDLKMGVELGQRMGGGTDFSQATFRYLEKAIRLGMAEQDYTLLYRDFETIKAMSPAAANNDVGAAQADTVS
jgi:3-hydroxyisobutyrate dehydrogenase